MRKTSKKTTEKKMSVLMAVVFAVGTLLMTACGKGSVEFACTDSTEKMMSFEADNADKGGMVMTGSLEVSEGEEIVITTALKKGILKLEFISSEGMKDIDHAPEVDKEALMTAEVSGTGTQNYEIAPGSYLVRVTVTEKVSGTVKVTVEQEQ